MLDEILLQLSVSVRGGAGRASGPHRRVTGGRGSEGCVCRCWALRAPPPCALQASVPVDVMPGEFDPTNYTLPQQPLHPCMFPLSAAYSTLQLVTNPYQAAIDGVR